MSELPIWKIRNYDCERKVEMPKRRLTLKVRISEYKAPRNVIPIGVPADKDGKPIDKFEQRNIHWERW